MNLTRRILNCAYPFALTFGFFCLTAANAGEPYQMRFADPLTQPWRFSEFRELEGQGVRCLTEDLEGRIWFGLSNGVVSYDGRKWRRYGTKDGLAGQPVRDILTRRDGTIVIGTLDGVLALSGEKWKRLFPTSSGATFPVFTLAETSGDTLWVTGPWGCVKHAKGHEPTLFTSRSVHNLAVAKTGIESIVEIPGRHLANLKWADGTGVKLIDKTVVLMSDDSPARAAGLRIGDSILQVRDAAGATIRDFTASPGQRISVTVQRHGETTQETLDVETTDVTGSFASSSMHCVIEDRHGNIWIAAATQKLLRLNTDGTWDSWSREDNLHLGTRPSLLESADGTIWAVSRTQLGGINRFDGDTWSHESLSTHDGSDLNPSIAQGKDGTIWVSGRNRLHAWRQGEWSVYNMLKLAMPGNRPRLHVARNGALWLVGFDQYAVRLAVTNDEYQTVEDLEYRRTDAAGNDWFIEKRTRRLVRWDGRTATAYSVDDGAIDTPVGIAAIPDGTVVAVGSHDQDAAIASFDGVAWKRKTFPTIASQFNEKSLLVSKDGRVWVAASRQGLIDKNQKGGIVFGSNNDWTHLSPPEAPKIAASLVEMPDGRILAVGSRGARVYDGQHWQTPALEGLERRAINAAVAAPNGDVWFATRSRGVYRKRGEELTQFTVDEGLLTNQVIGLAAPTTDDVWTVFGRGVCRLDGERFRFVNLPTPAKNGQRSVRALSSGGIWVDGIHRIMPDWLPPETAFEQDSIQLQSNAKNVASWTGGDAWNRTPIESLTWSVRMDGGSWSPFLARRQMVVEGLDAGTHRLEVRSRDTDFNIDPTPASLQITVLPPFWRQAWFVLLMGAGIAVIAWQSWSLVRRELRLRRTNVELSKARDQLKQRYEETSARFAAVCDNSPVGIFVANDQGKVTYANQHLCELMDRSFDEVAGHDWATTIHPDDRDRINRQWRLTVSNARDFHDEARLQHSDGSVVRIEVHATGLTLDGQPGGFVGAVQDVTSERDLKDALEQSRKQYQAVVEDQTELIVRWKPDGTRLFVNEAYAREYKGKSENLIGTSFLPPVSTRTHERLRQKLALITPTSPVAIDDHQSHRPDGSVIWREWTDRGLFDEGGQLIEVQSVGRDVTDHKQSSIDLQESERQLRELNRALEQRVDERTAELQEANADLESYAHSVAHDLRAPLRAMYGFAKALREDYAEKLDQNGREYTDFIEEAAHQMDQLINDLLAYSKVGRRDSSADQVDLDLVVSRSLEQLATETRERQAKITVDGPLGSVLGHGSMLVQVVSNLISNATKFVASGTDPQVRIRIEKDGAARRLWVEDNGIGIEPDFHQKIFGVFERLHAIEAYPGTGIGLAIVRRAIESLNGQFGVESLPGCGSQFWIELPGIEGHAESTPPDDLDR